MTAFTPLSKPAPAHPRTVQRWEKRLKSLSNDQDLVLHATLGLKSTKLFYSPGPRDSLKMFLKKYLPAFVIKLEVDYQPSKYLFPHAHLLLPTVPETRPFLEALKLYGAKIARTEYRGEVLPSPFSLLPEAGLTNLLELWENLPDLTPLQGLVSFPDSTITTLKNSTHLARYLAKTTYTGGLSPLIEHGVR